MNVESWIKCPIRTERDLSSGQQKLLVEVYEVSKHRIKIHLFKNRETLSRYCVGVALGRPGVNPHAISILGRITGEIKELFMPFIFHFFEYY